MTEYNAISSLLKRVIWEMFVLTLMTDGGAPREYNARIWWGMWLKYKWFMRLVISSARVSQEKDTVLTYGIQGHWNNNESSECSPICKKTQDQNEMMRFIESLEEIAVGLTWSAALAAWAEAVVKPGCKNVELKPGSNPSSATEVLLGDSDPEWSLTKTWDMINQCSAVWFNNRESQIADRNTREKSSYLREIQALAI